MPDPDIAGGKIENHVAVAVAGQVLGGNGESLVAQQLLPASILRWPISIASMNRACAGRGRNIRPPPNTFTT